MQNRFPYLWLVFQLLIGATYGKRQLAVQHYNGEKRVLEVGCSLGNITPAFAKIPNINYLGIDIDAQAIRIANNTFKDHANIQFKAIALNELAAQGQTYDYIIFAGMLHHVDDALATSLLSDAKQLLAPGGKLIVSEPEAFRASDPLLFRLYAKLEQGEHLRTRQQLVALLESVDLKPQIVEDILLAPSVVSFPKVIRFNLCVVQ